MRGSFCSPSTADRFAARLLADTDCQAFGMVERGYAALSQPGGTISTALTGLMVIAVAFFGFRLMLGRGILLTDAIALTVKIGIVLLIATSWESWQALAYDGLARAPTQVASEMLIAIGAPPPLESLQATLDRLTSAGVGYRTRAGIASPWVGGPAAAAMTLNVAAVLLTLATVGMLVAIRVVLAILLAIAPAMAGFLLFDGTRGMAQGWLGAIAAAALAPLFILLIAAVEFAVLAPMIARLLAEQAAGRFDTASVMPIGLVTIVFGIALVIALRSGWRIGNGIRLARARVVVAPTLSVAAVRVPEEQQLLLSAPSPAPRAARALESVVRRETPAFAGSQRVVGGLTPSTGARAARNSTQSDSVVATNHGGLMPSQRSSTRLRNTPRRSRAATRRDT